LTIRVSKRGVIGERGKTMGFVLRKDADLEGFRRRISRRPVNKIEEHGLGDRVLDLVVAGKGTAEIAALLTEEARGAFRISQPTVSRWLEDTRLFETRASAERMRQAVIRQVKQLFSEYQREVIAAVKEANQKHQTALLKAIGKLSRRRELSEIIEVLEAGSERRESGKNGCR
jgi:hypothetical protein